MNSAATAFNGLRTKTRDTTGIQIWNIDKNYLHQYVGLRG